MSYRRLGPAGLLVAGLALIGLGVVGPPASDGGLRIPPGVPILLVGAAAASWLRGTAGAILGLAAVAVVTVASVGAGIGPDLIGDRGLPVTAARWVQVAGLVVAAYALGRRVAARPSPAGTPGGRRRGRGRVLQIAGLLVLCGVGAELLAAYGDSTGDPGGITFALVFFGALYGAPALLARELVRRLGWGWPSLLLIFAALGTAQAGLIDQSLFSTDYGGYDGWEENREPTLVPSLGLSGYNAYSFIIGHVIYSFAAPVALAEAWSPARARKPWLGPIGTVLAVVAYAVAATLIVTDPESRSGTPAQLIVTVGVIGAMLLGAALIGSRRRPGHAPAGARDLAIWQVLGVSLIFATVPDLLPPTWLGVVLAATTTATLGILIALASRRSAWTIRHTAAVGAAYLLERGLLAFTYFPLIGDVAPGPKYAHNVIMLLIVVLATWVALRKRSGERAEGAVKTPSSAGS
ncbi:hypothetical protein [Nocardioides albus]|uniref:Uncharacterized protein n=1 Tax=Nocardioides albus TaxID=1841 RepID=A0A7W5A410_9ACTN|nr:hypothetical protein [Nocardioides albus]MBB3089073.1 hypothetical protein [Nocardioides albus]GGU14406.1 hypothetical protein GCM10007979_11140 [Nocardioides albus]